MAIPFATSQIMIASEANELARAHWRKTTVKTVVNTLTETDLLNGEITIDAGAMSTNRTLRLTAWGDAINNTGAAVATPRFKLKLGATTLVDSNVIAATWGQSASRFPWRLAVEIKNLGATNSQWTSLSFDLFASIVAGTSVALTTGEGWTSPFANDLRALAGVASAVDTTAAQALAFTVTLATANALEDVTLKAADVEVV